MTVSANRVLYYWSPIVGWALLACSASPGFAQVGVAVPGVNTPGSPSDSSTVSPQDQNSGSGTGGGPGTSGSGYSSGTPTNTTTLPPLTTSNYQPIILPPGTTVQNPSTQVIPGASDIFGGATSGLAIGGSGTGGPITGDELGITLGVFRLYPAIDITTGVDNNVFATGTGTGTTPSTSLSTVVQPTMALRSEWLRHSVNVALGGGFGFYASAPSQNYQNYYIIVEGKLDVHDDWVLSWSTGYRRATEALGTANTTFAQAPTVAESVPLLLGVNKKFNRVSIDASVTATKSWFTDFSTITSAGLDGQSRNRIDYGESFRVGYEISDDITLFTGPTFRQTRYDLTTNSVGQNRNSDGLSWSFGARWTINPTSTLEGAIGYSLSNSGGGLGSTSAYTFALTGTWNGYQPLFIRPNFSRGITETALSAYRNTISTVLGVDYSYQLFEEWAFLGGISYSLSDYEPIDGLGGTQRQDKFFRTSFGLQWQPRPQLSIGPVFEYTQGSSSDTAGPAYTRQLISVRLSARR